MKTNIKPHRLVVNFKEDGTFSDGILMYQVQDDSGKLDVKYSTLSIKSEVNIPVINGLIQKAIKFTKKQEGIINA